MTFALWTILLTACLPLIWVGAAKFGADGYDNHEPRVWLSGLEGWPQRANWAQVNSYEAFPPFAAGVLTAHFVGADQMTIDIIAGVFLLCRILHGIFYIQDKDAARSLVWTGGFLSITGLFLASAWTAA